MALYQNGILVSGANQLPQMTMAEYLAIPASDRPTYWICTDRDYDDLSADNVVYGSGTVEDTLDSLSTDVSGKVSKSGDTMTDSLTIAYPGTTEAEGFSELRLGNNIPAGTAGNSHGVILLYGSTGKRIALQALAPTADRSVALPDKSGTLALTDDITTMSIKLSAGKTYKITSNAYNSYIICGEYGSKLVYDILAVNNTPLLHHLGTGTDVTCTGISTTEVQITTPNSFAGFIMTGGNRFTIAEVV